MQNTYCCFCTTSCSAGTKCRHRMHDLTWLECSRHECTCAFPAIMCLLWGKKKKKRFSHCPASFLFFSFSFFYICSQKTLTQNQFNLFPKCLHLQANSFETFIITLPLGSLVTAFYWGSPALSLFSYLCYHPRYTGTARSVSIWTTTHVFFFFVVLPCFVNQAINMGLKCRLSKHFFFLSCIKCVEISTFFFSRDYKMIIRQTNIIVKIPCSHQMLQFPLRCQACTTFSN